MANDLGVEPVEIAGGQYLSVAQAGQALNLTKQAITHRIRRRKWPGTIVELPVKQGHNMILLRLDGVLAMLAAQAGTKRRRPRKADAEAVAVEV